MMIMEDWSLDDYCIFGILQLFSTHAWWIFELPYISRYGRQYIVLQFILYSSRLADALSLAWFFKSHFIHCITPPGIHPTIPQAQSQRSSYRPHAVRGVQIFPPDIVEDLYGWSMLEVLPFAPLLRSSLCTELCRYIALRWSLTTVTHSTSSPDMPF